MFQNYFFEQEIIFRYKWSNLAELIKILLEILKLLKLTVDITSLCLKIIFLTGNIPWIQME
jgi:hypothetical protein